MREKIEEDPNPCHEVTSQLKRQTGFNNKKHKLMSVRVLMHPPIEYVNSNH
jgi:hypothetical protein